MAVACLHKKSNTNFGDNVNKVNKQKVSLEFHAYIVQHCTFVKFIYSEKATNFCEISTVDLFYVVTVKSTVEISQNFVAFSEYINFKKI